MKLNLILRKGWAFYENSRRIYPCINGYANGAVSRQSAPYDKTVRRTARYTAPELFYFFR